MDRGERIDSPNAVVAPKRRRPWQFFAAVGLVATATIFVCGGGAYFFVSDIARGEELSDAAMQGDIAKMDRLIKSGVDVNYGFDGDRDETPLSFAVRSGNVEAVRYLLEHGAQEREHEGGCGSLLQASNKEIRKLLLDSICSRAKGKKPWD